MGCDSRWRTLPWEERITEGKSASLSRPCIMRGAAGPCGDWLDPWRTGLRGLFAGEGWSLRGLVGTLASRCEPCEYGGVGSPPCPFIWREQIPCHKRLPLQVKTLATPLVAMRRW